MKKHRNLKELHLDETGLTDAGLKDLANLKELKELYVADTKVTDQGIEELKAKLPALRIGR